MSADETAPPREPSFQTRIFIEKDGSVVFENLSEELLELAQALNPDASLACDIPQTTILDAAAAAPCDANAAAPGETE